MASVTAFSAFQKSLKSLCLTDFPCGIGSWNHSKSVVRDPRNYKLLKYRSEREEEEEGDVNEEDFDSLKYYLTDEFSPWSTVGILTEEAKDLKELAIISPFLLDQKFACSNLKSLKIVNKHVREVDEQMLSFQKLQELNLSVNNITTVNSINLPKTLKVLELCVNEISSLKELCTRPLPDIQHLGLAYNKLTHSQCKYLTPTYWPKLVSLDLSFNELLGLHELVTQLYKLPNLRNLILQGNPLSLLPQYRGFLIDSLPKLYALDDVWISANERHQFTGLSRNPQLLVESVQVTVDIKNITGIMNPIPPLESNPLETYNEYNYFVMYEFLPDVQTKPKLEDIDSVDTRKQVYSGKSLGQPTDPNTPRTSPVSEAAPTSPIPISNILVPEIMVQAEGPKNPDVILHKTQQIAWAEPMVADYSKCFVVTDLLSLKWLLMKGISVKIIEEKVFFRLTDTSEQVADYPWKKGKKPAKEPVKAARGQAGKGKEKKKKRKSSTDYVKETPILRTLGQGRLVLETLIGGGHCVDTLCDLGIPNPENEVMSAKKEDGKKSGRRKEDRGSMQLVRNKSPVIAKEKRRLSSLKSLAPQLSKLSGKSKDHPESEVPEDPTLPETEHLKVQFTVTMQYWSGMEEALKDLAGDE